MLLIYLSCVWVAGILLGSKYNVPLTLSLAGLIPLLLLFFTRRHRKPIIYVSLGIITILAAISYSFSSLNVVDESSLHYYNDRGAIELKGTVSEDPDVRDKNTRLTLSVTEIKLYGEWRDVRGKALIFVPRYPAYEYGNVLTVNGEMKTPPQLDDFDYKEYLAHQGIYATMLYPEIELLETGRGFGPLAWVHSLRSRLAQNLAEVLPEPQASLAQGVILGIRGNIPQELRDDFARSGTSHLLAISGLHLSIMAGVMLGIGLWLFGRRHYLYVWLALCVIWLYALVTGMHLPVVRGAIMASMFLFAELLGRQRSAIVALTFAAAVMVGVSPYILGDVSFQLSFLAMAGLVFLFPVFRNLGRKATAALLGEEGTTGLNRQCRRGYLECYPGGCHRCLAGGRLLLRYYFLCWSFSHVSGATGFTRGYYRRCSGGANWHCRHAGSPCCRLAGLAFPVVYDAGGQRSGRPLDIVH